MRELMTKATAKFSIVVDDVTIERELELFHDGYVVVVDPADREASRRVLRTDSDVGTLPDAVSMAFDDLMSSYSMKFPELSEELRNEFEE